MRPPGLLVLCAAVAGSVVGVRPPAAPPRDTPLRLSVGRLTLPNGLRVVIVTDPAATDVQVTMRYQVGAVDDPPAHGGMAHLVEHLVFDQVIDGRSIAQRLGDVATYFNAMTTHEATTYIARAHPDKLRELLAIEALRVRARCAGISDAEFVRERDVVLDEVRYREQATDVQVALGGALFGAAHPYSRPVAGTVASVSTITREQACAFAVAHHAIGKAVLVVSGKVTRAEVEAALAADLAAVRGEAFANAAAVAEPPFTTAAVETRAPLEHPGLVLVWPLPQEPALSASYRALVAAASEVVAGEIRGSVAVIEPGGARTRLIGLALGAARGETERELINAVAHGLRVLPQMFERSGIRELERLGFHRARQGALYRLFAMLDAAGQRDPMLADLVAHGIDPSDELRARSEGIRALSREQALDISRNQLRYDTAKVITFRVVQKQEGQRLSLTSRGEHVEDHRAAIDPAQARRPASAANPMQLTGVTSRKLRNGLEVVLLPTAATPIVDIRLLFRAGSADEPTGERGVASLAAHTLSFDERHLRDALAFVTAGGKSYTDVGLDHTTFAVRGTSSQLDFLLAGLRRIVRDGAHENVDGYARAVRRAQRETDERADAWRAAVFGAGHPYAKAGLPRHAEARLTVADAARFRAAHYTPDNATLVIAGQFDPATVDRWVDFLFADWQGRAAARSAPPTSFTPAALATADDTNRVELQLAFRATSVGHAERLVAAEMLSELTGAVRFQLGATYDASAELVEQRLSATYRATMELDAARAVAAARLVKERLARLHADGEFAARTFVAARQRVLARLASLGDSAPRLASRVEHEAEVGRDIAALRSAVEDVRVLTIDRMPAALADLTLDQAVVAIRGPAEVRDVFAALGRAPRDVSGPSSPASDATDEEDGSYVSYNAAQPVANTPQPELVDPLTSASSPYRVAWMLAAGASFATMERSVAGRTASYGGPSLAVGFGYRRRSSLRAGLQLGVARLAGATTGVDPRDVDFLAVAVAPFLQARLHGPFWAGGAVGLRFEHDTMLHTGASVGAQLGLDLVPVQHYGWLVAFARYDHVRMPEARYGEITVGAALRR